MMRIFLNSEFLFKLTLLGHLQHRNDILNNYFLHKMDYRFLDGDLFI